jgi:hypothetical protein
MSINSQFVVAAVAVPGLAVSFGGRDATRYETGRSHRSHIF